MAGRRASWFREHGFAGCLGCILTVAAWLRLHRVFERGLIYWDEGIFIMGARFVRWRTHILWLECHRMIGDTVATPMPDFYRGLPVFLQKPMHVLLLAIWNSPGWDEAAAAVAFSIFAGLIAIGCTAELGRKWFSPATGLIAAAWLAIQPYHIHYSRLALHETVSMAVFLLTCCAWQRLDTQRRLGAAWLTGALAMAAVGCSYRYLPFILLGIGWEIHSGLTRMIRWRDRFKRWLLELLAATSVFLLLNAAYPVAFFPDYLWSQPGSYWDVLKKKFLGGESSFDLDFPWFFLDMMYRFDGAVLTGITLIAIIRLFIIRSRLSLSLACWILVPFMLFSLTTTRVPRAITGVLPFVALATGDMFAAGVVLCRSSSRYRRQFLMASGVVAAVIGLSLAPHIHGIWSLKSGYPEVVHWLEQQGERIHLSTMPPVYAVYQGRQAVRPVPFTLEAIHQEVERTRVRYLTVDWQKFLRYSPGVRDIEQAVLPVVVANHNPGVFFATLYENHLPADVDLLREDPTLQFIKVYDLYDVLESLGYRLSFRETSDGS